VRAAAATTIVEAVLADSRARQLPAVEAEALLVRAATNSMQNRDGGDDFHAALAIGERIGDAAIRSDALIGLIADATADPARASEVTLLVRMIEASLAELPGEQMLRRARLAGNLAQLAMRTNDIPAAVAAMTDAEARFTKALGATHPTTLMARQNLNALIDRTGDYPRSIAAHRELLATLREAYGDHPLVVRELTNFAITYTRAKRSEDARPLFEEALALADRIHGPEHVALVGTLRAAGYFFLEVNDFARAHEVLARAVTTFERTAPAGPELAALLVGLGQAEHGTGKPAQAVTTLERALTLWGTSRSNAHLLPSAHYALARALWDSGGDRRRARALALQARDGYRTAGGPWAEAADTVSTWLERHR
jgi:tetratricopeptide (TPR) repeat protein